MEQAASVPATPATQYTCQVCGKSSDLNEVYHPHYGAVSCNGCRLFFLRTHPKAQDPFFRCKKGK